MSVTVRYRKVKQKGFTVYLDIYKNYKRDYEYLDIYVSQDYSKVKKITTDDKEKIELAQNIRLKRELEIKTGEYGFTPAHFKKVDFITYLYQKALTKHHNYKILADHFKNFAGEHFPISDVNERKVTDFIDYMRSINLVENSQNYYMRLLNATLNEAYREKIISENPIHFIPKERKPKHRNPEIEYLLIDELRQLNSTPFRYNQFIRYAFLFACYTGLRISDLRKLTWDKITNDKINFRQKKSPTDFHYLPLNDTAKEILKMIPRHEHNNLIFWDLPASTSYISIGMRIWIAESGIKKKITFHCSRHTFAVMFLSNGGDIYTLKELLGHSSVTITEIYAKICNSHKDQAINLLPKL